MKFGGVTEFYSDAKYAGGFTLKDQAGSNTIQLASAGTANLSTANPGSTEILGLYNIAIDNFTVTELCKYYNTYFDLQLKNWKSGTGSTDQLQGNMFEGGLVPMEILYNSNTRSYYLTEAAPNATTFLLKRKADNAYVVMDWGKTWSASGINNHVTQGGFKFDKLSEDNLLAYIHGAAPAGLRERKLAFAFNMQHANLDNEIKYISVVDYSKALTQLSDANYIRSERCYLSDC